jgi:hypothetical protein
MLVVKVEIWPGGDESQAYQVGAMEIGNISGLAPVSDYEVRLKGVAMAHVRGHERDRGAWELIRRAITALQDSVGLGREF